METISNSLQIRKTIELHRSITQKKMAKDDFYHLNRGHASMYFNQHDGWREKISKYVYGLRDQNEQVIHLDICGEAGGCSLGATKTYSFSMQPIHNMINQEDSDVVYIDGDIFNPVDFSRFIKMIKAGGVAPAIVTFEPVAGLQTYDPENKVDQAPLYKDITYHVLAKRLIDVIRIMHPGGYIYIEKPFQSDMTIFADWFAGLPQHKWRLVIALRKITKKFGCTTELSKALGGPYFLIRTPLKK